MPTDTPDPDFEAEWLWGTRVTAEAARAAMVRGRTSQERFEIYERLIWAAYEARKGGQSPERGGSNSEATAPIPGNLVDDYMDAEDNIISGFESGDTS